MVNACETVGDELNALHIAAINENEVIIRILAAAPGFNVEAYSKKSDVTKLLPPLLGIWRELLEDGNKNLLDVASLLLELGADVNGYQTTDCNSCSRNSVLMSASYYGHLDWVTMLLATPGINVNHFNKDGATALDYCFGGIQHSIITNSVGQQAKQALRDAGGKCGPMRKSNCMTAYAEYQPGTYPW